MRSRLPLLSLLLLDAGLNLWGLELNGYANEYYSAAVRSMSQSWHAFLYGPSTPALGRRGGIRSRWAEPLPRLTARRGRAHSGA